MIIFGRPIEVSKTIVQEIPFTLTFKDEDYTGVVTREIYPDAFDDYDIEDIVVVGLAWDDGERPEGVYSEIELNIMDEAKGLYS